MNKKELSKAIKFYRDNTLLALRDADYAWDCSDHRGAMDSIETASQYASIFTALSILEGK